MTPWTIRAAGPGDAETIALHRSPSGQRQEIEVYARWVASALERGVYLGWLAEVEGAVVGGAGLTLLEWGPTRTSVSPVRGRVVNVFVDAAWRRRGLGTALVGSCLQEARAREITQVSLGTTPMARVLYARAGFVSSPAEMVWTAAEKT